MVKPTQFEIDSEFEAPTGRITPSGELDIASTPQLEEAVQAMLEQGATELVIDLKKLTFVDSSGLRLFIDLNGRRAAENWTLSLIKPAEPAFTVFEISGADENLPFIEDPALP